MTKIVYNNCYGGFSLSEAAMARLKELGAGLTERTLDRTNPLLVRVVEELGEAANGRAAELQIAKLPPGTKYFIDEYDGAETVVTAEDIQWKIA